MRPATIANIGLALALLWACGCEEAEPGPPPPGTCETQSDCASGDLCREGVCVRLDECATNSDCAGGERCDAGQCVPLPGCTMDSDCVGSEVCEAGECVVSVGCVTDSECEGGLVCLARSCASPPGCTRHVDCAPDELCDAGACVMDERCGSDDECPSRQRCDGGSCSSEGCLAGESCNVVDDDCDGAVDESFDLMADLAHCGACDAACDVDGATPECLTGECVFTCDPGRADCNADVADGCEVDLGSVTTCGACEVSCPEETPVCATGSSPGCVTECPLEVPDLCGGSCVDTATALSHCGACDERCETPNGTPVCSGGSCAVAACDAGWADCDDLASTGCETSLGTAATCGACGDICPTATPVCELNACVDVCSAYDALSGSALRNALLVAVQGHRQYSYRGARDLMYGITGGVDIFDGLITSLYSGENVVPDGTRTPGGTFNTEHTWPRSEGATSAPAEGDMHHIFPCDEPSNMARENYEFGETDCDAGPSCMHHAGGSELGLDASGAVVFEVRPARRGDVARAHFYFAVRYGLSIGASEEATLRAWHAADPPDARERERNRRVTTFQLRSNVFIDCPAVVDRLTDI